MRGEHARIYREKSRVSRVDAARDRRALKSAQHRKSCHGQMNVWLRREDSHSSPLQNFGWLWPDFL
jgi:hypothetical protein